MINSPYVKSIKPFLEEDVGSGDLTASIIPLSVTADAEILTRDNMVLCGRPWVEAVFQELDKSLVFTWMAAEGESVAADTTLCSISGNARALLTGERTALNLLQTLSATATISRSYAEAVAGTGCKILDTRKTIPGLRMAQKYAVTCGSCYNHRMGLYDGILIKENHIMAAGSIAAAVRQARRISSVPVEVEVENMDEFRQAIVARPDRIMLDNFSLQDLRCAVEINTGAIELEASGNIGLHNIGEIAATGVDFISIGALTKNVTAIDLSMRIKLAQ